MPQTFILDTCVLIHNSDCLSTFKDSKIIIPTVVLEELDNIKTKMTLSGKNARVIIKKLYEYCKYGMPKDGLSIGNGNLLFIDSELSNNSNFNCNNNDDKILSCAMKYEDCIMVSRDANLLLRAVSVGMNTIYFEQDGKGESEIYSGYREMNDLDFEGLTSEGLTSEGLESVIGTPFEPLYPNEFAKVMCNGKAMLYRRHADNSLKPVRIPSNVYSIRSKNMQQAMMFDLLLDPNVTFVSVAGNAGSGKTLLSLAAGISQTIESKQYPSIELYRAISSFGGGKYALGFLPGDVSEKLTQWVQPYMDALGVMMKDTVADFLFRYKNKFSIQSLEAIRGRTLSSFVIIDETQEASLQDVKGIISRAGAGCKIVMIGDQNQIESSNITESNSGFTTVIEKFKPFGLTGHVTLEKCERSDLANLAATVL
jgi:PhoH-like ATPase